MPREQRQQQAAGSQVRAYLLHPGGMQQNNPKYN